MTIVSLKGYGQDLAKLDSLGVLPEELTSRLQLYQATGGYKAISLSSSDSHPFFQDPLWVDATVNYRGQINTHQKVIYDLLQDIVFLSHPVSSFPISLDFKYIEWFTIGDSYFTKVKGQEGYYELLFESGELQLFKKYEKLKIVEEYTENFKYILNEFYYLKKGEEWIKVRGKRTFTKLFPEAKKEINAYYKSTVRSSRNPRLENTALMLTDFAAKRLINE